MKENAQLKSKNSLQETKKKPAAEMPEGAVCPCCTATEEPEEGCICPEWCPNA